LWLLLLVAKCPKIYGSVFILRGKIKQRLFSVHPETLPKLKLWTPRCPLFGIQSFSFGNIFGVSGWRLFMKTDKELKQTNPKLYRIARENGTEARFSGKYVDEKNVLRHVIYLC
jgi:hypothetical protein